nr:ornithine cyclodeaminase family protein [Serratia rubidaea]
MSPDQCLRLSRDAFRLVSQGKVQQSLRSVIASAEGSLMGTMPAYISEGPYAGFGLKTVKVDFGQGKQRTSHEGCILLYDAGAESAMALVDAASITELRTAAASAVATDLLTSPEVSRLAILGTGIQARKHAVMMLAIRPFQHMTIWGRSADKASEFALWCRETLNIAVSVASTPAQAVKDAEVICTVTASKEAFLYAADLPGSCHINAIGASAPGFQEISPEIYAAVELFVDDREAVWHSSTCLNAAKAGGLLPQENTGVEIGELLIRQERSTMHNSQRTLFKSVGIAAQDLVFARALIRLQQREPKIDL